MATLMDTIKKNLEAPAQAPQLGQTEQLTNILSAKSGTEVGPSSGPRQSSMLEQSAANQTRLGSQQQAQQGMLQGEQQSLQKADIEQGADIKTAQYKQAIQNQQSDFLRTQANILDDYSMGNRKIQNDQDIANLEQIGFTARLMNDQYINKLQESGTKARLNDGLEFKRQVAATAFANNMDMVRDEVAFATIMDATDREFQKELAKIDINSARSMGQQALKAFNAQSVFTGVGNIASAGMNYYQKSADAKKDEGTE